MTLLSFQTLFAGSSGLSAGQAIALGAAVIAALALTAAALLRYRAQRRRAGTDAPSASAPPGALASHRHQMETIAHMAFTRVPLLNRNEARLLPLLEWIAQTSGTGIRLMAQTSLGQIIRPDLRGGTGPQRDAAHATIASKHVEFAFFDRSGMILLAVEYQAGGQAQNGAHARDAVKHEALRRAGIELLEIESDFDPDLVVARVCHAMNLPVPGHPNHSAETPDRGA